MLANYYKTAQKILEQEAYAPEEIAKMEISLYFTDNEEIHRLNKEYRSIDRPTDVLSFAMDEMVASDDFMLPPDAEEPHLLGDIIISADKVMEQAKKYGHSPKRELAFLIAHSMFHLCGYDHMTEKEAQIMEQKQEKLLTRLGITREN